MTLITSIFFFFNDTATTEIYTLSLHDALPIYCFATQPFIVRDHIDWVHGVLQISPGLKTRTSNRPLLFVRSEEHTSELQSQSNLVCRLLLEKKKQLTFTTHTIYQ